MQKQLEVKCPHCKAIVIWNSSQNPNLPFCSASCKNADFLKWACDEYKIEGEEALRNDEDE